MSEEKICVSAEAIINQKELVDLLLLDHADSLPKWYCELNCFEVPEDFPIKLNNHDGNREEIYNDQTNQLAFRAIKEALGRKGSSRAWWTVKLGRSDAEWRAWWKSGNNLW